jgi:hypothetical protein
MPRSCQSRPAGPNRLRPNRLRPNPLHPNPLHPGLRCGTMNSMNADQVAALRALLGSTGWLAESQEFARALRSSARTPGGLLLVGTPDDEPWHLTAHLDDESRLAGLPGLAPTLVRWQPPADAPPHLRVGLERLEASRRGETLFVVSPATAPVPLLERVNDARRTGATIFALDQGDPELDSLAHESLNAAASAVPVSFDAAQHLVSAAAAARQDRLTVRQKLARVLNLISGAE